MIILKYKNCKLKTMKKLKQTIECCDVFKSTMQKFEWFSFDEDGKKVYAMPYIENNGVKYRINYCFSCGKEIRDVNLNKLWESR